MQPTFEVRAAVQQDILAVAQIRHLAYPKKKTHSYENNIVCAGTINAVAVKGNVVVGFVSTLINDVSQVSRDQVTGKTLWMVMRAYIAFLVVHPDHRQQGVGTALLNCACDAIFRLTSYQQIYLECEQENIHFYEKRGFRLVPPENVEEWFHHRPEGSVLQRPRPSQ